MLKSIHALVKELSSLLYRFIYFNSKIMLIIPRLFAIAYATILRLTGSTTLMSTTQAIPKINFYIIQLALFTCLILVNLFLILITFSLSFILFLYIQDTYQSLYSRHEISYGHVISEMVKNDFNHAISVLFKEAILSSSTFYRSK